MRARWLPGAAAGAVCDQEWWPKCRRLGPRSAANVCSARSRCSFLSTSAHLVFQAGLLPDTCAPDRAGPRTTFRLNRYAPMSTVERVKIGLDECRMLALGAQVLIGFQFQGVFQPGFADLPSSSKMAHIAGLLLLLGSLGFLIVPSTQHILAERLRATRRIETILTRCLDMSLLPLAGALALDVGIAVRTSAGGRWALVCGAAIFLAALGLWFAWTIAARSTKGAQERMMASQRKSEETPLAKQIEQMLTEARTVLPGAQALLGFQLTVFLAESFAKLHVALKVTHVAALLLIALSVLLLMTPAAYHRIVYAGEDSKDVLRVGSRTVTLATIPLGAALALDTYVVCSHAFDAPVVAAWIAGAVFCGLIAAWLLFPILARVIRPTSP
jgi:hypothetical protein